MTATAALLTATPPATEMLDAMPGGVIELDHETSARLDEERERAMVTSRYADLHEAPAHAVAVMLGQSPRAVGTGPILLRLRSEIDAGRLLTADDIKTCPAGATERQKRRNWATVPISRDDLRDWLLAHGSDADRASPAARWAGQA